MHQLALRIVDWCVRHRLLDVKDTEILLYRVEMRLTTIVGGIFLFGFSCILSNFLTATCFFLTYFYVRKYANGYHAKTFLACFVISMLGAISSLYLVYFVLPVDLQPVIAGCSFLLVSMLAPFNHPAIHLTDQEAMACNKSASYRSFFVFVCSCVSYATGMNSVGYGITAGSLLVSFMLCLGYITKRRNNKDGMETNCSAGCKENGCISD